jgi:murein DD-endopeptidase MepM/ murein hydrolase activator NlpD
VRINPPAGLVGLAGVAASVVVTPVASPSLAMTQPLGPGAIMLGGKIPAGPIPGADLLSRRLFPERHAPEAAARKTFPGRFPVRGRVNYGGPIARFGVWRPGHIHQGQDVFAQPGTPLVAVHDGVVLGTGGGDNRGNWIAIYSRRVRRTYEYFHMQAPALVGTGKRVREGQMVGRLGCTGHCDGPHLHFEIHRGRRLDGNTIDPLPMLRRWKHLRRHGH